MGAAQEGSVVLRGPHRPRAISFRGLEVVGGWTLKVYGVSAEADVPRPELVAASVEAASWALPDPAQAEGRYGIGFVIAHDAADYCFALVDWWQGENEIHQRLFSAPLGRPDALRLHPGEAIGCVWELAVTDFERRAWLRHVLDNPEGPDMDAYLNAHFSGKV
ncbi:hypothetical protein ACFY0A_28830 [Streptomyces sp. NPDC001698]|uniref:hypothetical protein n=1 Tax=Streptomyces sp. NPDC001698 TaxID=3364601 RepID=UPI0036D12D7C